MNEIHIGKGFLQEETVIYIDLESDEPRHLEDAIELFRILGNSIPFLTYDHIEGLMKFWKEHDGYEIETVIQEYKLVLKLESIC